MQVRFRFYWIVLLCFMICSCNLENVSVKNVANFKLQKLEGRDLYATFDAVIDNPNALNFKAKPTTFDLYINNQLVGDIALVEKVKIPKKSESTVNVPVKAVVDKGALSSLIFGALSGKPQIRIVGKAKVGIFIFNRKKEIDETRSLSIGNLNLKGLLMN